MAGIRLLSPWQLRLMLNWFPPLLFQRIKVREISSDFLHVRLRAKHSIWNRNLNGTIYGGTIYSAADPVFPVMYWQALAHRGLALQTWLMATEARFLKPGATHLDFDFTLTSADIDSAEEELNRRGKAVRTHSVQARDLNGNVCAEFELVSYLRLLRSGDKELSGF
jgi:acyl-coenzyme A thioesterase PaaI-like protein